MELDMMLQAKAGKFVSWAEAASTRHLPNLPIHSTYLP